MEPMIAVGLLVLVAATTLYAMLSSNRFAVSQRYVSNAKALCQERVDQALISQFPTPAVPPSTVSTYLGQSLPLPTTDTANPQITENVAIYTLADASPPAAHVGGIRKTWLRQYTLSGADYVRVRVRVEFWVSGRGLNNKLQTQGATPFFYEMTTLRAPD